MRTPTYPLLAGLTRTTSPATRGLTFVPCDAEKVRVRLKSWFTVLAGLLAVDAALAAVGDDPQLYRLNLANVVTFGGMALRVSIWAHAGQDA